MGNSGISLEASHGEYMGFWIRAGAAIIDRVLIAGIEFVIASIGLDFVHFSVESFGISFSRFGFALWGVTLVGMIYGVLFIGLKGRTPGKFLMGIQVVDSQGKVPGLGKAFMREVPGKIVSTIVLLLGYIWVAQDPRKRGWHDHISGTYVIRRGSSRS